MAREKYRLQALLTIKEREKKKASELLAAAVTELTRARELEKKLIEEKKEIQKRWREVRSAMRREMDAGAYVSEGNRFINCMRDLKDKEELKQKEIEEQRQKVADAEEGVQKARVEYIEACKEYKVMEKHKELWRKKVEAELTKKEERELDELGNIIYQLRKWHKAAYGARNTN